MPRSLKLALLVTVAAAILTGSGYAKMGLLLAGGGYWLTNEPEYDLIPVVRLQLDHPGSDGVRFFAGCGFAWGDGSRKGDPWLPEDQQGPRLHAYMVEAGCRLESNAERPLGISLGTSVGLIHAEEELYWPTVLGRVESTATKPMMTVFGGPCRRFRSRGLAIGILGMLIAHWPGDGLDGEIPRANLTGFSVNLTVHVAP